MVDARTPLEEWRPVERWPYEISSLGRLRRHGGQIVTPHTAGRGYLCAWMQREDATGREYIHRLVAKAFLGEPPADDSHADHINGVTDDNRLENLRWLSPEENRARRRFVKGESHGRAKLSIEQVRYIKDPGTTLSHQQLAASLGISPKQIRDIRNGNRWRHI